MFFFPDTNKLVLHELWGCIHLGHRGSSVRVGRERGQSDGENEGQSLFMPWIAVVWMSEDLYSVCDDVLSISGLRTCTSAEG